MSDILDKDGLPGGVKSFLRTLGVALVTTVIVIIGIQLAYGNQTAARDILARTTLSANLAQACVLSLPVDETGRDPELVRLCFTQYDLEPPILHNP